MTDAALALDHPAVQHMDGPELASLIAAKLCHDFISPSGAIVSGLDLLNDPTAQDMREDALALITDSAMKMVALVQFCRVAFGAAGSNERFTAAEVQGLVEGLSGGGRATLAWRLDGTDYTRSEARVLLNLSYLTVAALPSGGTATLSSRREDATLMLEGVADGARARLKPEAATGLAGERLTEGLAGQWIQPYWLWLTAREAGGRLDVRVADGQVTLTTRLPT
ncbi:MAG: histidine phosphotransferase [Caulobacteraceae bacterium]|nr:histidine phosphotransferase [Caulobacteraceae bacterium]